jgi:hypothetical protein
MRATDSRREQNRGALMIGGTYYIDFKVLILYEANSDETISSQKERVGTMTSTNFLSHVPTVSKFFKPAPATFDRNSHLVILDGYLIQKMIVNSLSVYSASAPHVPEG